MLEANKPVVSFDASRGEFVAAWHTVLPREEGAGGDLANELALVQTVASSVAVPSTYSLAQNYPNPFNPVTQISFALPEAQQVRVTVFDMLGRVVKVLADEHKSAGTHTVSLMRRVCPVVSICIRSRRGCLRTPKK